MSKINLKDSMACDNQPKNSVNSSSVGIMFEDSISSQGGQTNTNAQANNTARRNQQNQVADFQQSLDLSQDQGNILELMRSKSGNRLGSKDPKQLPLKLQKKPPQQLKSLQNTNSFDDTSMKLSFNKKSLNMYQLRNVKNVTDCQQSKKLQKPQQMLNYKFSYPDSQIKVKINQLKNKKNPEIVTREESEKALMVQTFGKNQASLTNIKSSNAESQSFQNFKEASYNQPYFKSNKSQPLKQDFPNPLHPKENEKKHFLKPNITMILPQSPKNNTHKQTVQSPRGKKLTLRDYILLNELSSNITEKDLQSSPNSLLSPSSQLSSTSEKAGVNSPRKKKLQTTNSHLFLKIKSDILNDLKLMQSNIKILTDYFQAQELTFEPQHTEIMKMYAASRMIKQKMLMGSEQIVKYMKEESEERLT